MSRRRSRAVEPPAEPGDPTATHGLGDDAHTTERQGSKRVIEDDPFGGALDRIGPYVYRDEDGEPLFRVVRRRRGSKKTFHQERWDGKRFVKGKGVMAGVRLVPYQLSEVLAAIERGATVYLVEGEKDCHAMGEVGLTATCNPMGAGEWRNEYAEHFRGAEVKVIHDRDGEDKKFAGQAHALDVYDSLRTVAKSVKIVRALDGKDAADHLDAGHDVEDFQAVIPDALRQQVASIQPSDKTRQEAVGSDGEEPEVPAVLLTVLGLVVANGGRVEPPTASGGDYSITCPMHEDSNPSATLNIGSERPIVFHCFGGCDQDDLFRYLTEDRGIDAAELMELHDPKGPFDALVEEVRGEMDAADDRRSDFYRDLLTEDQLADLDSVEFVIGGFCERRGYGVIYGPAGTGKTAMSSSAAKMVSLGRPWLDCRTERGAVLFLTGEGMAQINLRLRAAGVTERGDPILFGEPQDIERPEGVARIVATVRRIEEEHDTRVQLIVVDPLMEFMSPDENGEGMHRASRGLRALAILTDTAVLVIHHTNASGEQERGNKVLRQRALSMTRAEKRPDGDVTLIQDKVKNAGEHVFSLLKRPDVDGIAFELSERWPKHEFEALREEWTEQAKANKKAKQSSAKAAKARELLTAQMAVAPDQSERKTVRACLGKGVGEEPLKAELAVMVRDGAATRDDGGQHPTYSLAGGGDVDDAG